MAKQDHKIVYVEWQDSASLQVSESWIDHRDAKDRAKETWNIVTVGFLLEETDDYILLCRGIDDQDEPKVSGSFYIPKSQIRKRKWLK